MIFKARIFSSKLAFADGNQATAQQILENLVKEFSRDFEQAEIYFWLHQFNPNNKYKNESLERYKKLYEDTPLYLFEERIRDLTI